AGVRNESSMLRTLSMPRSLARMCAYVGAKYDVMRRSAVSHRSLMVRRECPNVDWIEGGIYGTRKKIARLAAIADIAQARRWSDTTINRAPRIASEAI